jgi:hypothetical protein
MIEDAIFLLLRQAAGSSVAEDCSPTRYRIYPLVIPQHENGDLTMVPCIVYSKVGAARSVRYAATDNLVQATFQVDSYATTYRGAAVLANTVRAGMVDYAGTLAGMAVKIVNLTNEFAVEDPDPGLYRISQSFAVWYVE